MCGIVGYVGMKQTTSVLLHGLERLEYRGYDSAGIAVINNNEINVVKCQGRLKNLKAKIGKMNIPDSSIGIGHTRWATHGEPNDINSHPHISDKKQFCVVHNGIIENYIELKQQLMNCGYSFTSNTDSEVITHLMEYNYNGSIIDAIIDTVNQLKGSYALGIICKDHSEKIYCVRKESPLIIGKGEDENFIASDIPAILKYTKEVYILDDGEISEISKSKITIFDSFGNEIEKAITKIEWDVSAAEKEGYEHFMLKEIHEEPKAFNKTVLPRINNNAIVFDGLKISKPKSIKIVACGTAYHAAVVGKYIIEDLVGIPVQVDIASEFRYRKVIFNEDTLTIIISQSGETIDTLFAMRKAKENNSKTLAVVNVVGSTIAREADDVIYTYAGPEIAVASTKAYTTQLSIMYLIALSLSNDNKLKNNIKELIKVHDMLEKVINQKDEIQKIASKLYSAKSIFFIGRGLDYALSMEGSLKLKEISYIHSEAYAAGELKHGTIALIEKNTPVFCLLTQPDLLDKMISNAKEVKTRGAYIVSITMKKYAKRVKEFSDIVIEIPDVDPIFAPITAITPLQLFAYYCSVYKGCDVDKPRNLAKSVTVE